MAGHHRLMLALRGLLDGGIAARLEGEIEVEFGLVAGQRNDPAGRATVVEPLEGLHIGHIADVAGGVVVPRRPAWVAPAILPLPGHARQRAEAGIHARYDLVRAPSAAALTVWAISWSCLLSSAK